MEEKKYFLTVDGERVEVTEEVYREYMRPEWREEKRRERERRCGAEGGRRCCGDCGVCPYALAGGRMTGTPLSLDALMEEAGDDFGVEDPDADVEREAERDELRAAFARAREKLNPREKVFFDMVLDGRLVKEIAARLSMAPSSVVAAKRRLYKKFRILMKDYAEMT